MKKRVWLRRIILLTSNEGHSLFLLDILSPFDRPTDLSDGGTLSSKTLFTHKASKIPGRQIPKTGWTPGTWKTIAQSASTELLSKKNSSFVDTLEFSPTALEKYPSCKNCLSAQNNQKAPMRQYCRKVSKANRRTAEPPYRTTLANNVRFFWAKRVRVRKKLKKSLL